MARRYLGLTWPNCRMIEIDPQERLPEPRSFEADGSIHRALGGAVKTDLQGAHLERPPIRDGAPKATEAAIIHRSHQSFGRLGRTELGAGSRRPREKNNVNSRPFSLPRHRRQDIESASYRIKR